MDEASKMRKEIELKGTIPSDVTCNSIMNVLCNEVPKVENFDLLNVIERKHIIPTLTHTLHLHFLCKEGYLDDAEDFPKICQLIALFETLLFTTY